MNNYCKMFQSFLDSSVWAGTEAELRTWLTLLLLKNKDQIVKISVVGLANRARVKLEECKAAIEKFKAPDPDSGRKVFEGRKLRELEDGGWEVINGDYYAKLFGSEQRREYNRRKQAEYRAGKRKSSKGRVEASIESGGERGLADVNSNFDNGRIYPRPKPLNPEEVNAKWKDNHGATELEQPPEDSSVPGGVA